jgi:hypothetical protein
VDLYDPAALLSPASSFSAPTSSRPRTARRGDVGISDDHLGALDEGEDDPDGDDLVTVLLREQPHIRREIYQLASDGRLTASDVIASMFRAVAQAHRQLADPR